MSEIKEYINCLGDLHVLRHRLTVFRKWRTDPNYKDEEIDVAIERGLKIHNTIVANRTYLKALEARVKELVVLVELLLFNDSTQDHLHAEMYLKKLPPTTSPKEPDSQTDYDPLMMRRFYL